MENRHQVNLKLADNLMKMLEALCQYYDSDQSHQLRRLIEEAYERMLEKKAREALIQTGLKEAARTIGEFEILRDKGKPIVTEVEVRPPSAAKTQKEPRLPRKKADG